MKSIIEDQISVSTWPRNCILFEPGLERGSVWWKRCVPIKSGCAEKLVAAFNQRWKKLKFQGWIFGISGISKFPIKVCGTYILSTDSWKIFSVEILALIWTKMRIRYSFLKDRGANLTLSYTASVKIVYRPSKSFENDISTKCHCDKRRPLRRCKLIRLNILR